MTLPATRRRREWFRRILLVLLSTACALGMLELAVRVVLDRYRCDAQLGWSYIPGKRALVFNRTREFAHFVKFNGDGLRDRELPRERDPGTFRILLLGDSFTAGLQVPEEQSFPKLLQSRLAKGGVTGSGIEVWNAGVDGFGTAQALRMYDRLADRYQPNVVFLGFFVANDLADHVFEAGGHNHYVATRCGRPYFVLNSGGQLSEVQGGGPVRQARPLLERVLRESELYASLFAGIDASRSSFTDWDVFTGKNADAVARAWRLTQALVDELDRQVKARNGKLIVLLIPHEEEARVAHGESLPENNRIDFARGHILAEGYLRKTGIPFVDLYPPLHEALAIGRRPYFHRDMHWNGTGHEIVAAVIHRWLLDHCEEHGLPLAECTR